MTSLLERLCPQASCSFDVPSKNPIFSMTVARLAQMIEPGEFCRGAQSLLSVCGKNQYNFHVQNQRRPTSQLLWSAAGMSLKTRKLVRLFEFTVPLSQSQCVFGQMPEIRSVVNTS